MKIGLLGLIALFACTPPIVPGPDASDSSVPPPPPPQDASSAQDAAPAPADQPDASTGPATAEQLCAAACAALRLLDCPEGDNNPARGRTCEEECALAQGPHTFDLKPACLAAAKTKDEARACGTVQCAPRDAGAGKRLPVDGGVRMDAGAAKKGK